MKKQSAPIIVTILLLLPVLYVGSYLALVVPPGSLSAATLIHKIFDSPDGKISNYRAFPNVSATLFWPLEQIDRKLRPSAWIMQPPPGFQQNKMYPFSTSATKSFTSPTREF